MDKNEKDGRGFNNDMQCLFVCLQVVQSALEHQRKPDEGLFRILLERLKLKPEEVVFLDDIGTNLKAAKQLGFQTIKVTTVDC